MTVPLTYTAGTVDPEEDPVYYKFSWGDGTESGWIGPYASGTAGQASHAWSGAGLYEIRVRAKDARGANNGGWSDDLEVRIAGFP
jgi:hypothetical protein